MKFCSLYAAIALLFSTTPLALAQQRRIPFTPEVLARWHKAELFAQAGKDAAKSGDYADAILDFRAANKLASPLGGCQVELAMALDYGGKRDAAFSAYREAFGMPLGRMFDEGGSPEESEAVARFGLMCEDRGLHRDAVRCFNLADTEGAGPGLIGPLDDLTAKSISPSLLRALLKITQGCALEEAGRFGRDRSCDALTAFSVAVRLASADPRPQFFLAYGLRRAGRFTEAEAALRKVSRLDRRGDLKFASDQSLILIRERRRD